ncbi:hypothetical protein DF185_05550 [Marinifilum breve]|uniref:Uncharacterized protein n=1 Tax=Marinifilum breve TaxID=2184082 RepID=A0A2V4A427_9BACT|nr:hypothetical protein [Marinifilum breve]PXY02110.1 hypothetical protein DF185_05550 [Marinifilum breve]
MLFTDSQGHFHGDMIPTVGWETMPSSWEALPSGMEYMSDSMFTQTSILEKLIDGIIDFNQ